MTIHCNFCGRSKDEVAFLVAGPCVFICDNCSDTVASIIAELRAKPPEPPPPTVPAIQRAIRLFPSQTACAAALGIARAAVGQWLAGETRPSPQNAKRLEELTAGAVRRHELRPDIFDAPTQAA